MNSITKIPKFRRCVLQNFPFIEQDFDALTDYALISKVVEYLNKTIDSQNSLSEDFVTLTALFNTLKEYVDNYFDNLDVQEEINNKLDDMAEDGTLVEIINAYLQTNVATVTDGYALTTLGQIGYNTQTGAYYRITDTEDLTHVQHLVDTGKYATVIDTVELNNADTKVTPMSSGLVSRLASCASTYINNKDDFVYGGTYSALHPVVTPVDGKWEINCSTFAVLMMYGIRYENSAYTLGSGNNIIDTRFCEDKEMFDWFSSPNEGQTGDYQWKYTYDLAKYMYERGRCFEPNEDLSNIQPGDILFLKNQISGEGVSTFRDIDHSAIFGWWVTNNSYVVFEVGNKPSAQLYLRENLENNLVLVGRMATKPCADDFQIASYQQDTVSSDQSLLSFIRCKQFEPNEFYTLIAKIENSASIADVYPVIYQASTRVYGYDMATEKPEDNVYIMPFLPAQLNANIALQMNTATAGITRPTSTLSDVKIVKGLLTKNEITEKPQRTLTVSNQQSGFSVSSISITPGFASLDITGALANGNNYICDIEGLHRFSDIMPCMGTTYTYTSGYSTTSIVYNVDFRLTTPRLVIKAGSAVTDGTFVKHTVIIPLMQS